MSLVWAGLETINENYHLIDIGAGTRELEEWEDVTQEMVDATNIAEG